MDILNPEQQDSFWTRACQRYASRRLLIVFLLGFSSGLPLALSGATLQAWFSTTGVSLVTIGLISLTGYPYALKFLWAPFLDRYAPLWLGRRRSWLLITQLLLIVIIAAMAFFTPANHPALLGSLALLLAFTSASQDTVIDAHRTESLTTESERGIGTGFYVVAYRIAMLVSGSLALILAAEFTWRTAYLIMAAMMFFGVMATLFGPEPHTASHSPCSLSEAVIAPFREFWQRSQALPILAFVLLYQLGSTLAFGLHTPFLLRVLHFSLIDVALINKGVGLVATLAGGLGGGLLISRLGLLRALVLFGFLQGIANLTFTELALIANSLHLLSAHILLTAQPLYMPLQALLPKLPLFLLHIQHSLWVLATAVTAENFTAGMQIAAFLAFLTSLCEFRYTATQFALLSALSALTRVSAGPIAAFLIQLLGWSNFFFLTFVLTFPALGLLYYLRRHSVFRVVTLKQ